MDWIYVMEIFESDVDVFFSLSVSPCELSVNGEVGNGDQVCKCVCIYVIGTKAPEEGGGEKEKEKKRSMALGAGRFESYFFGRLQKKRGPWGVLAGSRQGGEWHLGCSGRRAGNRLYIPRLGGDGVSIDNRCWIPFDNLNCFLFIKPSLVDGDGEGEARFKQGLTRNKS